MVGKTLGHYQITSQLGKGGMGEVYQAKDQRLGRDVAIKVLPEEFAKDTDRVARFQREAKLLASLNHPNIAAIYGLEESEGTNFLVLELIEGETLADQLKRGPITVEESLKLALQIAEALEAAHEKGVIHRDLKPANIKVTPDGKVKVLDFGLAKAFAGEQQELNLSNSPTLSNAATQQGVILGTAAYMSPEQARGKSVDKRADIWAFGCVLYEMLTGRQTWTGATVTDIIAAALAKEPDYGSLPPNIHPRIREMLGRCLQKDPVERFRDVGDVRMEIKQILADPKGALIQPVTAAEPQRRLRTILPWIAALVLTAIIAGVVVWKLRSPEPHPVIRFECDLPEGQQFTTDPSIAVSPDGKQFVYSTTKGLYLRSVDELTAKPIAETEGAAQPFFSPDGKWIGYFSGTDRQLKKIAVNGGSPVALCNVTRLAGASWSADDTIVYGQIPGDIMRVSASGGTPEPLVKAKDEILLAPKVLPDAKSVLYTRFAGPQGKIMVHSLESGETKELLTGFMTQYLQTGHLVYTPPYDSRLFAIRFNLDRLEAEGESIPIIQGVGPFAISNAGTLAYIPRTGTTRAAAIQRLTPVWVDRKGKEEQLSAAPNAYSYAIISPDGKRVALTVETAESRDIWVWDVVRETMTRLTFDNSPASNLLWTPDGKRIVYSPARRSGSGDIYWKAADGTGEAERLGSVPGRRLIPCSWSRDGKILVLSEIVPTPMQTDISMLSMGGNHERKPLLQEKYSEYLPQISPDGRWMAYQSNESGKYEIYVRPFPGVDKGKWQVSVNGGDSPLWSPDGRELFYRSGDSFIAVAVETEPSFELGKPGVLFRGTHFLATTGLVERTIWSISPDGKRFLMLRYPQATGAEATAQAPNKINIVLNWLEELKKRVPVK